VVTDSFYNDGETEIAEPGDYVIVEPYNARVDWKSFEQDFDEVT
jgi:hypothetical protein